MMDATKQCKLLWSAMAVTLMACAPASQEASHAKAAPDSQTKPNTDQTATVTPEPENKPDHPAILPDEKKVAPIAEVQPTAPPPHKAPHEHEHEHAPAAGGRNGAPAPAQAMDEDRMEGASPLMGGKPPAPRPVAPTTVAPPPAAPPPVAGVARESGAPLRAGRHDDNKEYSRFLDFLAHHKADVLARDVHERLIISTVDKGGKGISNCDVEVQDTRGHTLAQSHTYADGRTLFFPAAMSPANDTSYKVAAHCDQGNAVTTAQRNGPREIRLQTAAARHVPSMVPLDVAIVIDTTGSMQEQIDRLRATLEAIHLQITSLSTQPDVRFGLVAYRDHGDEYVTRVTPFTSDVRAFKGVLDTLQADGGGDTPEDLQAALEQALHTLAWRPAAVKLGFFIADAPPHTDYPDEKFTYIDAMNESLERGIKWTSVGAGGLGSDAEAVFRQIAQYTMGEYVFVTESAPGDREGGGGEASHHVGTNYHAENLDQAIVRIVRRELSYFTDAPHEIDETLTVSGNLDHPKDVVSDAIKAALAQLQDYSALQLSPTMPVALVPVAFHDRTLKGVAESLSDEMLLAASRTLKLKLLDRDLKPLAAELKVQLSDLVDVQDAVPIGKLLGAQLLVVTKLTVHESEAELFTRLVRVETGEVLSVAKVTLPLRVLKT